MQKSLHRSPPRAGFCASGHKELQRPIENRGIPIAGIRTQELKCFYSFALFVVLLAARLGFKASP
ncbi:MAG: hypothetical protein ACP5NM_13375, partial [Thiomonas sp.]